MDEEEDAAYASIPPLGDLLVSTLADAQTERGHADKALNRDYTHDNHDRLMLSHDWEKRLEEITTLYFQYHA